MSSRDPGFGAPETRRRVLQAAWELIEEEGAAVRLVDVAERAGISRQALYLHFGDRAGLLCALVEFMDKELGVEDMATHVFGAETGADMLDRTVELYSRLAPEIDPVARVLEAAQYEDEALQAAWHDRMDIRKGVHRTIIQRIADESSLADDWSVDAATELFHVVTMPGTWRELAKLGWSQDDYRERITQVLRATLIVNAPTGNDS